MTEWKSLGSDYESARSSLTEAESIMRDIELEDARRKEAMPDEQAAIKAFFDAWLRLQDFGWKQAIYCPKDGSVFEIIEPGSTGIHKCHYQGDWPKGTWLVHGDYDLWPSRPALFRPLIHPEPNDDN